MKTKTILAVLFILIFSGTCFAVEYSPEDLLKMDFPNLKYQSFRPSPIPGVYEVVVDDRIVYYAPSAYSIIFGQIVNRDGKNLTRERDLEILGARLKDLPLDQAVKIGNGKNTVVEFTDPDCPYCRDAEKYLATKKNEITKYVFFVPLASHPDAVPKIRYIFCAKDKEKAFDEAMSGKLDKMKFEVCSDPKIEQSIKAHEEAASKMGISATPTFFINGKPVRGADIEAIDKLLSGSK